MPYLTVSCHVVSCQPRVSVRHELLALVTSSPPPPLPPSLPSSLPLSSVLTAILYSTILYYTVLNCCAVIPLYGATAQPARAARHGGRVHPPRAAFPGAGSHHGFLGGTSAWGRQRQRQRQRLSPAGRGETRERREDKTSQGNVVYCCSL